MLENIVKCRSHDIKESRNVILDPHLESDLPQSLITARGAPLDHANVFVIYLVD